MCGSKIRYSDVAKAKQARHHLRVVGWYMNVYRCPFCRGYHIGHAPNNKKGD